jgi:hypothetical protein
MHGSHTLGLIFLDWRSMHLTERFHTLYQISWVSLRFP